MYISNVLHYPKRFKVATISHQVDIEFYQKLFEHFGLMSVGMCMSMSSHIYIHILRPTLGLIVGDKVALICVYMYVCVRLF